MQDKLKNCGTLFGTFFKIGAFTFGGGYAMIPLIQAEVTEKHDWLTDSDIMDIIAIAESTPGPIAINSATFVGYRVAGVLGAFCATLGVVLPSFLIILAISSILAQFQDHPLVRYAFTGIRAGVVALIIKALWSMYKQCSKSILAYCIMAAALIASAFLDVHVLLIILSGALLGLGSALLARRNEK